MRNEIQKIVQLKRFFSIVETSSNEVIYTLEKPSQILLQNINVNWLKFIHGKTQKHMPVFLEKKNIPVARTIPFGFLNRSIHQYDKKKILKQDLNKCAPKVVSKLKFNLVVPEQDVMQYFIQWQRYRKFWWSSITTTPSLFGIDDIKYGHKSAEVNIIAKFPWGQQIVETVTISSEDSEIKDTSCLSCTMSMETALFVLLMDALNNNTEEGYLRIHRNMAPYKFSFALDTDEQSLKDLASLLFFKLQAKEIPCWLPDFSLPMDSQIKENLQIGVTYTALLKENTLVNGIFHLFNSSTMLKEQVHVADIDSYAALICGK